MIRTVDPAITIPVELQSARWEVEISVPVILDRPSDGGFLIGSHAEQSDTDLASLFSTRPGRPFMSRDEEQQGFENLERLLA